MKMMTTYAMAGLLTVASAGAMAGDVAAGKAKYSSVCASCHGANGMSQVATYPNLAGQKEQYLVDAMKAYKDGTRQNATMQGMIGTVNDQDIVNIAAYLASLSCK